MQGIKGQCFHEDLIRLKRFAKGRIYTLSQKGLYGFETTSALVSALRRAGFDSFVILERRNVLRWLVSAEIGIQHKVWHVRSLDPPKPKAVNIPLRFDEGISLYDRLLAIESWYPQLRTCLAGSPVLNLTYENDIVPAPTAAYRLVCDFVGVEAKETAIYTGVVNPFPLQKTITNFDEVRGYLNGTRFEWMINE